MTTRLILICHASTDAVRRFAFPADEPLDERGKAQAAALARMLPSADRFWASPELRTRQTAEALQLKTTVQSKLCDCDYGAWKGNPFSDVLAREPDAVSDWLHDLTAAPHGGESLASLMQRVAHWLDEARVVDHRAILITHASIIRAAIVRAIEAAPQSYWRIDIAPLSMTRLSGANGRWNLTSAGCCSR